MGVQRMKEEIDKKEKQIEKQTKRERGKTSKSLGNKKFAAASLSMFGIHVILYLKENENIFKIIFP